MVVLLNTQIELLRRMKFIRAVEDMIAQRYAEQEMRCPVHLSIGQEATAAAVGLALRDGDKAVSSHRSHAHYLAMGGDAGRMIAEIYGKASGCCGGRGGSMHLTDLDAGFVASTAIVGNSIPVGAGLAMAEKLKKSDAIVVIFIGEGATETGVFAETINFTAVHQLPVLFVCENNLYSVYTPLEGRQPNALNITKKVEHMGIPSSSIDGTDALLQYQHFVDVITAIRSGKGPRFVECPTYRYLEHCGPNDDDHLGYRPEHELDHWKTRDPIETMARAMRDEGEALVITAMDDEASAAATAAFEFALASSFPSKEKAYDEVFSHE